jgi:hypothetical protein
LQFIAGRAMIALPVGAYPSGRFLARKTIRLYRKPRFSTTLPFDATHAETAIHAASYPNDSAKRYAGNALPVCTLRPNVARTCIQQEDNGSTAPLGQEDREIWQTEIR